MEEKVHVLVLVKKSAFHQLGGYENTELMNMISAENPVLKKILPVQEKHEQAVKKILEWLKKENVNFRVEYDLPEVINEDFILTLGGDGTLLFASNKIGPNQKIMAINTTPQSSVGFFCAGVADDFPELFKGAMNQSIPLLSLTRMQASLNGNILTKRILNDLLFCHKTPATSARYLIKKESFQEEHTSSGIWIGPAAGSTAAQHSAGGDILPLLSKDIQFVVRELYKPRGKTYQMEQGLVSPNESLFVWSKISDGKVYWDGSKNHADINLGDKLEFRISDEPLQIFGVKEHQIG